MSYAFTIILLYFHVKIQNKTRVENASCLSIFTRSQIENEGGFNAQINYSLKTFAVI